MRLSSALVSLAATAAAYNVPNRFANGVYEMTLMQNTDGEIGTIAQYEINPYLNYTAKHDDTKLPFPKDEIECAEYTGTLQDLHNPSDDVIAMEMLANWCELYNPRKGAIVVAVYNANIWYMCNWDVTHNMPIFAVQHCGRREVYEANILIDRQCKRNRAGELHTKEWLKHYGRGVRRGSICNGLETWD